MVDAVNTGEESFQIMGIKEMGQLNTMHNLEFSFAVKDFHGMIGNI